MLDRPKLTAEHERLVREVASSIGLCLLLYQDIEIVLKTLVPHMVRPEHKHRPLGKSSTAVDLFASKETLGPLFETFKKHLEVDQAENFNAYLSSVADHRNELVHGFRLRSEGWLRTEQECRIALALLDERHRFASHLQAIVNAHLQALVAIWDAQPEDAATDPSTSTSKPRKCSGTSSRH